VETLKDMVLDLQNKLMSSENVIDKLEKEIFMLKQTSSSKEGSTCSSSSTVVSDKPIFNYDKTKNNTKFEAGRCRVRWVESVSKRLLFNDELDNSVRSINLKENEIENNSTMVENICDKGELKKKRTIPSPNKANIFSKIDNAVKSSWINLSSELSTKIETDSIRKNNQKQSNIFSSKNIWIDD